MRRRKAKKSRHKKSEQANTLLADPRRGLFSVEEKRGDSGQHNHEDDKLPAGHSDMQKDGHGAKHEKYYHKKHNGSEGFHHITYIHVLNFG